MDKTNHELFIVDNAQLCHLSKKTDYPAGHEFLQWEYLRHQPLNTAHRDPEVGEQGADYTRFKKGFHRRQQHQINQDYERQAMQVN